jgi:lipoprotein-anchoring transpeptidase ErfK/SrfK
MIGGVLGVSAALATVLVVLVVLFYTTSGDEPPRVADGVTLGDVSLGGLSVDEAAAAVGGYDIAAQPVALVDEGRQWTRTLGQLGVQVNPAATMQHVETAAPGTTVQPVYAVDLSQTQDALIALSAEANIAAVPGDPPQIGRAVDIPAILNRLYLDPQGELADGRLELTMIVTEPPPYDPMQDYDGVTTTHIVEPGQELALIARQYGVDMQQIVALNDLANPDLLYVGQELTIPAAGEYRPGQAEAPAPPATAGKAIVVSTAEQRIYAYENGQLIRSHLTSTGRTETPTVKGDFKIYVKYEADDMRGEDYFLPDVPYTMYFHAGYGIHGTYWHNSFGRPMSHGCVNLPTDEARWFFEWAEVNTPVRVL